MNRSAVPYRPAHTRKGSVVINRWLGSRIAAALVALLGLVLLAAPAHAQAPSPSSPEFPAYVMRKIDDQYRGAKSHGVMHMEITTEHWTRNLELESWSLGTDYSLVRILSPLKEKGTATLKAKGELFTYLNKTGRTIKISSGMMGGSWMGSHFTNDDLVRHTRLSDDFTIRKTFEGDDAGTKIYRFELTPKPNAPVVWGKITVAVRQSDLQPVTERFYDEDGKAVRELAFSEYKDIGSRRLPTKMVMRPLDRSGEYTAVSWNDLDFEVKLEPSFFTLERLKSM